MIVNAFYNEKGVGDTLLIETGEVTFENREWERRGDVARIFDRETKENRKSWLIYLLNSSSVMLTS
ncbi:Putative tRNA-binding protein ytpR [Listeria monocytogenes N53-1]|nr:Putative tRNA-binding protein ytpR [Listeria monocytogenes]CCQ24212.1 Putative tRNA-binding protein ytpR [Listeria monocytogenes N53-1]